MSLDTALFAKFLSLTLKRPTIHHATKSQTSTYKKWDMLWVAQKYICSYCAVKKYITNYKSIAMLHKYTCFCCFFFLAWQHPMDQGFLIHEVSRLHTTFTTLSRTLLNEWPARRRDLYLTTHTPLTTDKPPCPRWDSNPQSQQTSARRSTP